MMAQQQLTLSFWADLIEVPYAELHRACELSAGNVEKLSTTTKGKPASIVLVDIPRIGERIAVAGTCGCGGYYIHAMAYRTARLADLAVMPEPQRFSYAGVRVRVGKPAIDVVLLGPKLTVFAEPDPDVAFKSRLGSWWRDREGFEEHSRKSLPLVRESIARLRKRGPV